MIKSLKKLSASPSNFAFYLFLYSAIISSPGLVVISPKIFKSTKYVHFITKRASV